MDSSKAMTASEDRLHREPLLKQPSDCEDGDQEEDVQNASNGFCKVGRLDAVVLVQSPADEELGEGLLAKDDDDDNDFAKKPRKFPPEKCKTLAAFGFFLLAGIFNALSLAIVHDHLPEVAVLPDVGFYLLSSWESALEVAEVLLVGSTLAMYVVMLLHKHRFILLRRYFLMMGILFWMRSISLIVTLLPLSETAKVCFPKENSTNPLVIAERVVKLTKSLGMSINGAQNYCGDYIYSGHTVSLTLSYLIIQEYTPRRCVLLHWLSWMTSLTAAVLLVVARFHYTIDILLAYYVTTRVFYVYHTMANNMDLKTAGSTNYLAKVWWFSLFGYFERNVKDRVPMQYDWKSLLSNWPMEISPKGELDI